MIQRFIRCRQCNQLLPQPRLFGDFESPSLFPGVEWSDEDEQFRRQFTGFHGSHPQEEIWAVPETIFCEKPGFEPVKTSYFEATNGCENFLIQRTKSGLAHPARYEILPGRMEILNRSITIQEVDLRKQISAERGSSVLSSQKITDFIQALKEEAAAISPRRLFEATEETVEGDCPRVLFAVLKEKRWEKILNRLARNFQDSELSWVRKFIQEHRQPGDVLSLLVHRTVSFSKEESPAPARRGDLAPPHLAGRKPAGLRS